MQDTMSFDEVITLTPDQATLVGDILISAGTRRVRVRVAVDDGGVKVAAGRETWSPPIGTPDEESVVFPQLHPLVIDPSDPVLVERVAREMHRTTAGDDHPASWDDDMEICRQGYRDLARAAMVALSPDPSAAGGDRA